MNLIIFGGATVARFRLLHEMPLVLFSRDREKFGESGREIKSVIHMTKERERNRKRWVEKQE